SQMFCIQPVAFRVALGDQPHTSRVGHDHFEAIPSQLPTDPRRVAPHLEHHPSPGIPRQLLAERRRLCRDSPARHELAVRVDRIGLGKPIAHVQTDRDPRLPRDTLHFANLLWASSPLCNCRPCGTALHGLAFSSHLFWRFSSLIGLKDSLFSLRRECPRKEPGSTPLNRRCSAGLREQRSLIFRPSALYVSPPGLDRMQCSSVSPRSHREGSEHVFVSPAQIRRKRGTTCIRNLESSPFRSS